MWPFPRRSPTPRAFRHEAFGGIVQLESPRALVFIDRDRARYLGHEEHALWGTDDPGLDATLSGPLEAHLQLTNRCTTGCKGCYTAATPEGAAGELDEAAWKRSIDALAARGVFHLALGGGESATLPYLGSIAAYARARGLVPNLTTSGILADGDLARLCDIAHHFGQINVSLDGIGDAYARVRGVDGFARADEALVALRRVHRHVGINCVVTRENFDDLPALFAHAKKRRLREIELLRFKPSGRGIRTYESLRCTDAQHRAILPTALALARQYRLRVRLDCSYAPMIAHHKVPMEQMRAHAIYGCAGGDLLVGAKASGALTACSFARPVEEEPGGGHARVDGIGDYWETADAFGAFRRWKTDAQEPCRSCEYLAMCRGGCRVVSEHVLHDLSAPDPECPRVVDSGVGPRRLPVL